MKTGKFIVVEGISGSGQQVKAAIVHLHKTLSALGYDVVECANPDSGRARELGLEGLLNWPFGRSARADFMFESAVRTGIFKNIVAPALAENKIVLCKQSSISSLANAWVNGFTKQFDLLRHLDKISRGFLFADEIYPSLTIFMDVPADEAFERVEEVLQINHEGGIDYYEKMRDFYLSELPRWNGKIVDARFSRSQDEIDAELQALVTEIL